MTLLKRLVRLAAPLLAAVPAAFLVPQTGWAQIEEIVVTTRRREENLQEVPIAVTAVGSQQLERQGIRNLFDLANLDPSVQFDVGFAPSDTTIAIRGLSNSRGRANAAILVDGIDVTSENLGLPGSSSLVNPRLLTDVERVEIVKGPQSALYGRSAFAGAVSYTTKNPTEEFEAKVSVDLAEYQRQQADIALSGPLGDSWGYRIDGVAWTSDGYYENSISGGDLGGGEGEGGALTLVFEPSDRFRLKSRISYSDDEYDPRPQVQVPGTVPLFYSRDGLDAGLADTSFWLFREECGEDVDGNPIFCNPDNATDFSGIRAVGLKGHGFYCPDNPAFDDRSQAGIDNPGFCVVKNYGDTTSPVDGSRYRITQSEDWRTGKDYPGATQTVFRASLVGDWSFDYGTWSSLTGYTDAEETNLADLDNEAFQRPDILLTQWEANTEQDTTQFSQEFRFASNFDGPLNFTAGALYWYEKRELEDANVIIACLPVTRDRSAPDQNGAQQVQIDPEEGPLVQVPGVCDGGVGGLPPGQSVGGANTDFLVWQPIMEALNAPGTTISPFTGEEIQRQGPGVPWDATTDHYSLYGMLEWDVTAKFKATVEARFVWETLDLTKPNKSTCDRLGFAVARGTTNGDVNTGVPFLPLYDENSPLTADDYLTLCTYEDVFDRNNAPNSEDRFQFISGEVDSDFITPKLTLEYMATEETLFYASYAEGQKPGGINTLTAGGGATTIAEDEFDSEKLKAYELGGKTGWELAGYMQFNFAGFYQDYTDKQVATQKVVDDRLVSRVENASSAEVWGVEISSLWQPSFVDGLTLSAAYTWLDPTFDDYVDITKSLIRAAEAGECTVVEVGGENFCQIDLSGNDLELTPRNAFVGQINLTRPFFGTGIDYVIDFDASYQDKRYENQNNFAYLDEYWLANLRLGLTTDRWEVLGYVENVFDDDTIKTANSAPNFGKQVSELGFLAGLGVSNSVGTLPNPRVYGVRASYRFGAN
jgi:outer membrane receptor protein involved in Fe transport